MQFTKVKPQYCYRSGRTSTGDNHLATDYSFKQILLHLIWLWLCIPLTAYSNSSVSNQSYLNSHPVLDRPYSSEFEFPAEVIKPTLLAPQAYREYQQYLRIAQRRNNTLDWYTPFSISQSLEQSLQFTTQSQVDDVRLETHAAANYRPQVTSMEESEETPVEVQALYVNAYDQRKTKSARLGRQTMKLAGEVQEIDGIALSSSVLGAQRLHVVAGNTPENIHTLESESDQHMFLVAGESGRFAEYWHADIYASENKFLNQEASRRLGSRLRYLHPRHEVILKLDIDREHDKAQCTSLSYAWKPHKHQRLQLEYDYRKPNALAPHSIYALNELMLNLSEAEYLGALEDDLAVYQSGAVKWNRQLTRYILINSAYSTARLTGNPLTFSPKREEHYELEVAAKGLWLPSSESLISAHIFEYEALDRVYLSVSHRAPVDPYWSSELKLEANWNETSNESFERSMGPSILFSFNRKDQTLFEFQMGVLRHEYINSASTDIENDFFIQLRHSRPLFSG